MQGLFINQAVIEKISKNSQELSLIAKGDNVEVMIQDVEPGLIVTLSPGDDENLMEFFYVLGGSLSYESEEGNVLFHEGDYFYINRIKGTAYFKTLSLVKILYVSSQPVFHLLSDEIQQLRNIVNELQNKDLYTHDHDIRLCNYSLKIGEALKISKESLETLLYSAVFHDIGKINTPIEILNKPGKLTESEFDIIKNHPLDGKNLVDSTFLKNVGNIILEHHERIDGSGYPNGLKGDEISLEAKIIAVVDSYDAMTSDRPYRKAMPAIIAMEDLKRLIGIHYDEKIVKVFEDILIVDGEL